jgi:tRNA (guanine-N7-)-methyltransferase
VTDHDAHVLGPGIRTYKPRRSRITQRQSIALREQSRWLLPDSGEPLDLAREWGRGMPVVVEIGFGTGEATARMAVADPATGVLAIDVHTPGVGNLLDLVARNDIRNVRVMETDALGVLRRIIPAMSLAGVRSYFPDPWPKARHHKRRLVQPAVLDLVANRLEPGGTWFLATDWDEYAESILACFANDDRWAGSRIDRPAWRPETRYERRALRDGRGITDLAFRLATTKEPSRP